jgi:hypothetical protein
VNELQDAIEMLNVVAKDGRVSSPVFRRHRASSAGSLIDGEAMVRYRQNSIDMRREPGEVTSQRRNGGAKSTNPLFAARTKAQAKKKVRNVVQPEEAERPEEGAIAAREREADIKSKSTESTAKSAEVAEAVKAAADVAKAAEAAAAKAAKTSSTASGTAAESAVADRKDHEAIATVGETTSESNAGGASCLPNISLVAELNPHSAFSLYSHLFCLLSL